MEFGTTLGVRVGAVIIGPPLTLRWSPTSARQSEGKATIGSSGVGSPSRLYLLQICCNRRPQAMQRLGEQVWVSIAERFTVARLPFGWLYRR
jgi:hypothetical protein